MIIYLNWKNTLMCYTLTDTGNNKAQIPLNSLGIDAQINIEYWENTWNVVTQDVVQVCKPQKTTDNKVKYINTSMLPLKEDGVVTVAIKGYTGIVQMYTVKPEDGMYTLNKYRIPANKQRSVEITVGRSAEATIMYKSKLLQDIHCKIRINGKQYQITAQGNVWVDGKKIQNTVTVSNYATIRIYNLKICLLPQIIAVNAVANVKLAHINMLDTLGASERPEVEIIETDNYYLRTPRQLQVMDLEPVSIDNVPSKKNADKTPWILAIGPTLTMMLPMLISTTINATVNNNTGRGIMSYLGVGISMVLSALIGAGWGIGRKLYQKKQDKQFEEKRQEKYSAYITKITDELLQRENNNRIVMEEMYPTSNMYIQDLIREGQPTMWGMNVNHYDYGTIRIGTGSTLNPIKIDIQKEKFTLEDIDNLQEMPKEVSEEHKYVQNVPVVYDLLHLNVVGVVGTEMFTYEILRSLVVQLTHMYSYTDVQIGISANQVNDEMHWCKYLPHTYTTDGAYRLFGYDENSNEQLVSYVVNVLKMRQEDKGVGQQKKHILPYLVIFCYSDSLMRSDAIRQYINGQQNLGVTFVLLYGSMSLLPNGCKTVIENDVIHRGIYTLDAVLDKNCCVTYEQVETLDVTAYAKRMADYTVQEASDGKLPTMVDLFSLLHIDSIEHWDIEKIYAAHDTSKSIAGLLGMGHNKVMWLDIHEKQQGPHGLVAGMTGSGKSEMLQTLILSWALAYSPAELAFVLIDYKGGGMANIFAKLPHTAGIITNLEEDMNEEEESNGSSKTNMQNVQTARALTSIKAEIKHRQGVFKQYKINHIDAYTKMYKQKKVSAPMPHLIIIVDEFAELRKEQHSFISDLVSAARVGRSLGVHLILATQKPAGVVDDEIWSNSRFRCCLRVQDKQDSMGMLHRPEAAYLTQIGRMYYQVGTDEIFEEIQCAYTGAEYVPVVNRHKTEDAVFELVQLNGQVVKVKKEKKKTGKEKNQLDTSIQYICQECVKHNIRSAKKLWLPVLPRLLYMQNIQAVGATENLALVYGLADDVVRQQQIALTIPLLDVANAVVVGTAGSGKTTLLQTVLYNAVQYYTPDDIQFYICDYSSGILKAFDCVPHCGGVINNPETADEKMTRLMTLLTEIRDERRKLFDDAGVSNLTAYRQKHKLPVILFIIDNYAMWAQTHENLNSSLQQLLREGAKYGIQVLLTISTSNELKYNLRTYIQQYILIQMPDKAAYREFTSVSADSVPIATAGRGLVLLNGRMTEWQAALALEADGEAARNTLIREQLQSKTFATKTKAKVIPVLPRDKDYKQLCTELDCCKETQQLLMGYAVAKLQPYYFDLYKMYKLVISDFTEDMCGTARTIRNLLWVGKMRNYKQTVIDPGQTVLRNISDVEYKSTDIEVYEFLKSLNQIFGKRAAERKKYLSAGHTVEGYIQQKQKYFVYITDFAAFIALYQTEKLKKYMLETDKVLTDCVGLLANCFERGADYGIYIVAGFNREAHKQMQMQMPVFKAYSATKHIVHFGGMLNDVRFWTVNMPMAQQLKVNDNDNEAFTQINGVDTVIWIP